jgi:hypothetical protein
MRAVEDDRGVAVIATAFFFHAPGLRVDGRGALGDRARRVGAEARRAVGHTNEHALQGRPRRRARRDEGRRRSVRRAAPHTIRSEHMQMHMHAERITSSMDEGDRPGLH